MLAVVSKRPEFEGQQAEKDYRGIILKESAFLCRKLIENFFPTGPDGPELEG